MPVTMPDTVYTCESKRSYLGAYWDNEAEKFVDCRLYDYRFFASSGEDSWSSVEVNGVRDNSFEVGRDYHVDLNLAGQT